MFLVAYVMVMTEVNLNYLDPVCVVECKVTKDKVSSNLMPDILKRKSWLYTVSLAPADFSD